MGATAKSHGRRHGCIILLEGVNKELETIIQSITWNLSHREYWERKILRNSWKIRVMKGEYTAFGEIIVYSIIKDLLSSFFLSR